MRHSYFDLETYKRTDINHLLKEVEADKRLTDPAKIAADIQKKESGRKLALDKFTCRILAIGRADGDNDPEVWMLGEEKDEAQAINELFVDWVEQDMVPVSYNGRAFDHQVLKFRALALGVHVPSRFRKITRYSDNVIDLFADEIDFSERETKEMHRDLVTVCQWFGIDIPGDEIKGAEIGEAFEHGRFNDITLHVERDVLRTRALAEKLGVSA